MRTTNHKLSQCELVDKCLWFLFNLNFNSVLICFREIGTASGGEAGREGQRNQRKRMKTEIVRNSKAANFCLID